MHMHLAPVNPSTNGTSPMIFASLLSLNRHDTCFYRKEYISILRREFIELDYPWHNTFCIRSASKGDELNPGTKLCHSQRRKKN